MSLDIENILHFHSNGKLMLTGEYLVLRGAKSLAIPLKLGQDLWVKKTEDHTILWQSLVEGEEWFLSHFSLPDVEILKTNQIEIAKTIQFLLRCAHSLNSKFLNTDQGFQITTSIGFNINWGLGSSSSLVSNIAYCAGCDPYELNRMVFGGSGYDIACARSSSPIIYQLIDGKPSSKTCQFAPSFSDNLHFIWLNRKQNTRDAISSFDKNRDYSSEIEHINSITDKLSSIETFVEFEQQLQLHEEIMASVLNTCTIQQQWFSDFPGTIKSLGAWGGDFVLSVSLLTTDKVKEYFKQKGYFTVFKYNELV
jgi:mevalonate kinase